MAKTVKMSDIAESLHISTVTVSKALAGKKGVSEELRERIRALAKEMGYQQSSDLHVGAEKQSYNIGVLVSERYLEKFTSFYWELYQNIATQASKKECFTLFEVLTIEDENQLTYPKLLQEKKVDGLIL
ncbi:MAG: LacI family transcriptional regulator, purine nucleotide synthesis repressor, partial [Clostridiales bacterium]|nr:LacI family transcriptional regulator, purine nucleotide synthesis repressor [Clostridiales bacterium]